MGPCKTWTLDWTHELTDIWTPDKMTTMIHVPCMGTRLVSNHAPSVLYQWKMSKVVAVCTVH